jgi:CheY-like chemotaxis protein
MMSNRSATKRILLIDDDEDDRQIFLEVVADLNPSVVPETAINGAEGLRKLMSSDELPNLIFLDLNMPIMSGTEFLHEIRRVDFLKAIPIVILSTTIDHKSVNEAKALGAKHFIVKPNKFKNWHLELKRYIDLLN